MLLLVLYHAVVRIILTNAFAGISKGRGATIATQFAENALFQFHGAHALGGELRGRAAIVAWFERIGRLFPDLRLTPMKIVVNGPPWSTTIATRFSVAASLPDGAPYRNEGMQYVRLVWGRIVEDHLYEDTDALKSALTVIDAAGRQEALAPALA